MTHTIRYDATYAPEGLRGTTISSHDGYDAALAALCDMAKEAITDGTWAELLYNENGISLTLGRRTVFPEPDEEDNSVIITITPQ